MPCVYKHTTEAGKSRSRPIAGSRKDAGNERCTGGAGQQHPAEPFFIGGAAAQADRIVERVALIPVAQSTGRCASQDEPLQHSREFEASMVEVFQDGLEGRPGCVAWSLRFHRMAFALGRRMSGA